MKIETTFNHDDHHVLLMRKGIYLLSLFMYRLALFVI